MYISFIHIYYIYFIWYIYQQWKTPKDDKLWKIIIAFLVQNNLKLNVQVLCKSFVKLIYSLFAKLCQTEVKRKVSFSKACIMFALCNSPVWS